MAYREAFGISVAALKARLRESPCGAFAFYGPEELLKQFYLKKFVALIEKEGSPEFNYTKLDFSRNKTVSDLWDEVQILPFGGEKRLVVCRGLSLAKLSASDEKKILEILDDFPPYLILIFYMENEEFLSDKATLTGKKVQNLAGKMDFVNFCLQEEKVLLTWSKKILAADGLEASDRALKLLFCLCGNKMQIIRGELEKLSAFALSQNKREVTEEDVNLFAEDTAEFAAYHLSDCVLEGSSDSVEKILNKLKRQGVDATAISATVARALTNALLILEGADAQTCAKITKIQAWQVERYRRLLYGKKKENVEKALMICLDLEGRVKGVRSDVYKVTELALLEITRILRGDV
jgi:DNA polymerase III delta subunit